jgi:hypothetical protein
LADPRLSVFIRNLLFDLRLEETPAAQFNTRTTSKLREKLRGRGYSLRCRPACAAPFFEWLRRRGIDVLTAQEAGRNALPDPDQLAFATSEARVLVTFDPYFLRARSRREFRIHFSSALHNRMDMLTLIAAGSRRAGQEAAAVAGLLRLRES